MIYYFIEAVGDISHEVLHITTSIDKVLEVAYELSDEHKHFFHVYSYDEDSGPLLEHRKLIRRVG